MLIRLAEPRDLEAFRTIEIRAGRIFADVGMAEVARHEPPPPATLARYQRAGHAWAAVDDTVVDRPGTPVAYAIVEPVDGCLHLEQISVQPGHARQGIGRALIEHIAGWATGQGYPGLTLTTFTEVPWNGPYYLRCGFRFLTDDEVTPGLRAIRRHEADFGLDAWPRACMRRELG